MKAVFGRNKRFGVTFLSWRLGRLCTVAKPGLQWLQHAAAGWRLLLGRPVTLPFSICIRAGCIVDNRTTMQQWRPKKLKARLTAFEGMPSANLCWLSACSSMQQVPRLVPTGSGSGSGSRTEVEVRVQVWVAFCFLFFFFLGGGVRFRFKFGFKFGLHFVFFFGGVPVQVQVRVRVRVHGRRLRFGFKFELHFAFFGGEFRFRFGSGFTDGG